MSACNVLPVLVAMAHPCSNVTRKCNIKYLFCGLGEATAPGRMSSVQLFERSEISKLPELHRNARGQLKQTNLFVRLKLGFRVLDLNVPARS